jgi:nitroreductase
MELFEAIRQRRSMGMAKLRPDAVPQELMAQVLEAANWAPSHGDTEPWRFTVFMGSGRAKLAELFGRATGEEDAQKAAAASERAWKAPVWISIAMVPGRNEDGSLKMPLEEERMAVACAVQNLHLAACALGLAGKWHSKRLSIHPVVAEGLGLEAPSELLGFFYLGWPAVDLPPGVRGHWEEKVTWCLDDDVV